MIFVEPCTSRCKRSFLPVFVLSTIFLISIELCWQQKADPAQKWHASDNSDLQLWLSKLTALQVQTPVLSLTLETHKFTPPDMLEVKRSFEVQACEQYFGIAAFVFANSSHSQACDQLILQYCESKPTVACARDLIRLLPVFDHSLPRVFIRHSSPDEWESVYKEFAEDHFPQPILHGMQVETTIQMLLRRWGKDEMRKLMEQLCNAVGTRLYFHGNAIMNNGLNGCWHGFGHTFHTALQMGAITSVQDVAELCEPSGLLYTNQTVLSDGVRNMCKWGYFMMTFLYDHQVRVGNHGSLTNDPLGMRRSPVDIFQDTCVRFPLDSWRSDCASALMTFDFFGFFQSSGSVAESCWQNALPELRYVCAYIHGSETFFGQLVKLQSYELQTADGPSCEDSKLCALLVQSCEDYDPIDDEHLFIACIIGAIDPVGVRIDLFQSRNHFFGDRSGSLDVPLILSDRSRRASLMCRLQHFGW
eukprot:CAMPEP_0115850120 /NCGR_PEP_ID=MMETSP0287-20121206/11800_1 /TAXON_ID=412157 /ORGANISM="Chrysochromulina rotalis, Strain UIO044" /LENGTH=473 /DNA_ID=CAMNT_0003304107 /DNA_START=51 /DNA_END=1469 /DNA_ORIENTATION=-